MARLRSSSTPPARAGHGVHKGSSSNSSSPLLADPQIERPPVEIRTSTRRKKGSAAYFSEGRIIVVVPARMSLANRQAVADLLVERLMRARVRAVRSDAGLAERAAALSDRYLDGVRPRSIRWVGNQRSRWASCTPATGEIRVSSRLQPVPGWVLDSVIVHELAHLIEPVHSDRFRELERRYDRLAEADAYLAGYSLGLAGMPVPGGGLGAGEPDADEQTGGGLPSISC